MRISFCYIHGISNIDTLYFTSIDEQEYFFDRHEVGYIDTTFYPPHYNNSIRVSSDDFDFNSEINYVRFEYSGKYYYYFIDSIEYDNENLMTVNISMDVIQTYMFNIEIDGGIIERKFINRWTTNGRINRSYIRENVSGGDFIEQDKHILIDGSNSYYVFKFTRLPSHYSWDKDAAVQWQPCISHYVDSELEKDILHPFGIMINPVNTDLSIYTINYGNETRNCRNQVTEVASRADCIDGFIVPFNPYEDYIDIDKNEKTIEIDENVLSAMRFNYVDNEFVFRSMTFVPNAIGYAVDFDTGRRYQELLPICKEFDNILIYQFFENIYTDIAFHHKYIPQLLDESYLGIKFGNNGGYASHPLSKTDTQLFSFKVCYSYDTGEPSFKISTSYDTEDKFNILTSSVPINAPLLNDANKEYVANNRNRIWTGLAKDTFDLSLIVATTGISASYKINSLEGKKQDILSDARSYTPKRKLLKKKYQRLVNEYNRDIEETSSKVGAQAGTSMLGGSNNLVNLGMGELETRSHPIGVKSSSNLDITYLTRNIQLFWQVSVVRDIEQCAQYYHRNGFKVDENIGKFSNGSIFTYVNNRYYFNIIKMTNANVHLNNVIEDEDTCNIIKGRLHDGIRLWNVAPDGQSSDRFSIGTYQYDNVELDYLE